MDRWIKLYGKLLNSQYFKEPKLLQLVIYCLLKAQWKTSDIIFNGQLLHINPGEFITGRNRIAHDTGLTDRNIRTRLKLLEKSGFLTMQATKRFTRIRINNWHIYQGMKNGDQVNDQQTTNGRPTDDQVIDHIQEVKNDKKDKNKENRGFVKPSLFELKKYIEIKGYNIDPEQFLAFYDSKGWMIGKNKMKSWQAACVTWEKRSGNALGQSSKAVRAWDEVIKAARNGKGESDLKDDLSREVVKKAFEYGLSTIGRCSNDYQLEQMKKEFLGRYKAAL